VRVAAAELERLRNGLREAEETIEAIRSGEVDALVVRSEAGAQIYSLTGAEHPYRIYVERMQEGAVTVSPDGFVLYCNQRFAAMTGLPLERIISYEIGTVLPADAWEKVSQVFGANGDVVKEETSLRRADGAALAVGLTASRLPLEGGDVLCLVVSDLTEQREKGELRLAKEVAEKASLAKDAFLAALSHELRTPLTPALMAAVALEGDASVPEPARKVLAMIRRNVELEARLIDDLLDLTRIARGKLELRLAPLKVDAVLLRALEICQQDIAAKQLRVDLQLAASEVRLVGDGVRLQQACWNLIRNAVKFTPAGGTISVATGNHGRESVWIRVADSGLGFEPGAEARLFRAFEQGGRHITRQFGGLGLGLAITRSIVESHGGKIEARSPGRNRGATFTLELPLPAVATPAPAATPAAAAPQNESARRQRILLVEDHRDTRTNLERLLRLAGHEVHAAETAAEALVLAARHPLDLVISDLGLSDQSGLELMGQLRERHHLTGIAVSGYGMEEDIAQSRAAGFARHLTKPIRLDHLKEVIAELGRARPGNSAG
jgi:PAS domain S-box-containing protein